eukprot:5417642-Pleurochrysis_carterae.AAC.1
MTSSLVVMLSPMRRTAAQSFSATRESPRRECAGNERLRRRLPKGRVLISRDSIIESIARPADGDDAFA